ncbi:unnamed protein product [Blepharisma stoltei]|uniref:MIR domain-containing protein n=1 Tax=Blepharisma stoltei TaxID=1481888 RepID=A0AAU9JMK5_9CILI|nr:unnamed protein product [Blepharisma stoltei]
MVVNQDIDNAEKAVRYGVPFKLRHVASGSVLHSHYSNYSSGSYQQEVGCYESNDINDWWIVKGPSGTDLWNCSIGEPVLNNSIIRLYHVGTRKYLRSDHWHFSPTSYQQEVMCDGECDNRDDNDDWKLEIEGANPADPWLGEQKVFLIHVNTGLALRSNFGKYINSLQQEVSCHFGKDINGFWRVESMA